MPLSLKTSDRWFVAILPAVLLASLFWFAFASPKRTHIVAAQTEIESLGGVTLTDNGEGGYTAALAMASEAREWVIGQS